MDYIIDIIQKMRLFFGQDMVLALQGDKGKRDVPITTVEKISGYLRYRNMQGENILFRPDLDNEAYYLMIDHDAGIDTVRHWHLSQDGSWKLGRCIIESSPNNYQVWVRFNKPIPVELKRKWLKAMQADPGAAPVMRYGRLPGLTNRKPRHMREDGTYPVAKLIYIDLVNVVDVTENILRETHRPPSGGEYVSPRHIDFASHKEISRHHYAAQSESETDIRYAMALIRRGCKDAEIEARIRIERQDWHHHNTERKQRDYLQRTIAKAHSYLGI